MRILNRDSYLTKNELSEKIGISPNTIKNWFVVYKPEINETKKGKDKQKLYCTSYVTRVLQKVNKEHLLSILKGTTEVQEPNVSESKINDNSVEIIQILKENNHDLKLQIEIKDTQISKLQDLLKNEQLLKGNLQAKIPNNTVYLENEENKQKRKKWFGFF